MSSKGDCYIGTSGWIYSDWERKFYPRDLPSSEKLKYFSQYFNTTEINYSFYHLPRPQTFQKWYSQTPKAFIFSVKVSRFITHIKRMKGIKNSWERFYKNALFLKDKLGPFLFQFPPSFKKTEDTLGRIRDFLDSMKKVSLRIAFEFRNKSWIDKKFYKFLEKYNVAWVISDSSCYPRDIISTADFVYLRFHGPKELFGSSYTLSELKKWSSLLKKYLSQGKDIFCYFNNDFHAYAIFNAKTLKNLLLC